MCIFKQFGVDAQAGANGRDHLENMCAGEDFSPKLSDRSSDVLDQPLPSLFIRGRSERLSTEEAAFEHNASNQVNDPEFLTRQRSRAEC